MKGSTIGVPQEDNRSLDYRSPSITEFEALKLACLVLSSNPVHPPDTWGSFPAKAMGKIPPPGTLKLSWPYILKPSSLNPTP